MYDLVEYELLHEAEPADVRGIPNVPGCLVEDEKEHGDGMKHHEGPSETSTKLLRGMRSEAHQNAVTGVTEGSESAVQKGIVGGMMYVTQTESQVISEIIMHFKKGSLFCSTVMYTNKAR